MRFISRSKTKPRLVVHIGARKTATTYIQFTLGLNERALLAAGAYLPKAGRFDLNPRNIAYHHLAFEIAESPRFRPDLGGWDDLRAELDKKQPELVFLSCEVFESLITQELIGDRLVERLKSISDDITVVLVIRDWTAFINSMYNQAIKMFAIQSSFERYVEMNIDQSATKFTDLYAPFLADDDIRFVALTYDDLKDPDPLTAVLRAGGIDVDTTGFEQPPGLINTSLGAIGLEVTTMLGKYMSERYEEWFWESRPVQELHIKNLLATDARGWNKERFWGWTPELLDRFLPTIKTDMDAFANAVWGRDWPGELSADHAHHVSNFEHYPPDLLSDALEHIDIMHRFYLKLRD